jgi:nitroreductase
MIELLRKRRSIRKYAKKKIKPQTLRLLQEALLRSPSSRDIKPWHFIFVDDPSLLEKLSRSKEHGADFLAGAPLGIVVCADETKSDVWVEDCAIASMLVQMAALSLGLGSCWIQIRNRMTNPHLTSAAYIRKTLGIPVWFRVASIVAVGYPAEKRRPVPRSDLDFLKISFNGFDTKE